MLLLAWRNLTADRRRMVLATGGVAFAVLLMVMQLGYRSALLDSSVAMIDQLDADVILLGSTKYRSFTQGPFPRRRLAQAAACPGVASAWPLYVEPSATWRNPQTGGLRRVRVLGFNPAHAVFRDPDIDRQRPLLRQADQVLFDDRSRAQVGRAAPGSESELSGHRVRVAGTFSLGTDFAVIGTVVTSDRNFIKLTSGNSLDRVEIGLIRLASAAADEPVLDCLRGTLPDDVVVMTKDEFAASELAYWTKASPVGQVFALGTVVGFIIGMVVCYQILFTEVSEQLAQFATLKAMGHSRRWIVGVVLVHALGLAGLGYLAGFALGRLVYALIAAATGLVMEMNLAMAMLVLVLTTMMCTVSGLLAVRKVLAVDPAELF